MDVPDIWSTKQQFEIVIFFFVVVVIFGHSIDQLVSAARGLAIKMMKTKDVV